MKKNLEYYLNLPYTLELSYDPEYAWFIRAKELPGCTSTGNTPDEAVEMIKEAMQLWIEDALETGDPIPEPRPDEEYSGKFVVRVPKSLHHQLVELSDAEGVSLNQYINVALARETGTVSSTQMLDRTQEPVSTAYWPGLSTGVRRALLAAGFAEEAGRVDEQLFSGWVGDQLAAIQSAYSQGYLRDALADLENLASIVRIGIQVSPALGGLLQALELLKSMIGSPAMAYTDPRSQLRGIIQETYQPIKERMVSESRKTYSSVATKTESSLADQLFLKTE